MSAGNGRSELCDYEHEMSILAQLEEAERIIETQQQEIQSLQTKVNIYRDENTVLKVKLATIKQALQGVD